jgi:hypothetical protein
LNRWKEAVRLAFDSVHDVGVAVVTPDAEDVLEWGADRGVLFYDCGTPTRRWVAEDPPQRAVRGWLWRLRDDPLWRRPDPAFLIHKDGKNWNCTIGVLVPAEMSSILNPSDTVEFY